MNACPSSKDGRHCTHRLTAERVQCYWCGIEIVESPRRNFRPLDEIPEEEKAQIMRAIHNVSMVERKRGDTVEDVEKAIADAKAGIEYTRHMDGGDCRGVVIPFPPQG